jgi:FSR family fosmidomycin resistance protein-like MFS transporter
MIARLLGIHRTVVVLASTHFVVDGFGNMLTPLLPLLIVNMHLSLAAAGALQMCFQLANSVAQLGFGHVADRWRPRALLLAGPLVCVAAITTIGLATSPALLTLVLVAGGLGGAAFHPPAAALAHRFGGDRPGLSMSVHITSGTVGQAVAPLVFAPFVQVFGLRATPALMLPGLIALGMFLLPRIPPVASLHTHQVGRGMSALRPYARPLSLLYLIIVLRTVAALGFMTFVPVLLTRRGASLAEAGAAVSVFLFASGVGGFLGGPIADRLGPRRVILLSLVTAVPFLALVPYAPGWTLFPALAAGGLLLQCTLPVNVTFGQTLAPVSPATVSSLMMGFAWGTGGLVMPLVGMLADRVGIERMLVVAALVPLLAAVLALPLPRGRLRSRAEDSVAAAPSIGTDLT